MWRLMEMEMEMESTCVDESDSLSDEKGEEGRRGKMSPREGGEEMRRVMSQRRERGWKERIRRGQRVDVKKRNKTGEKEGFL